MTVAAALLGFAFLVDFPDRAVHKKYYGFINSDEIAFIIRRINKDRDDAGSEPWNFKKWLAAGKDWKIWTFALIFFSCTTQAYSLAYFLPIILHGTLGFDIGMSQLLSAPPYAAAGIVMYLCAWVGDRYKCRGPLIIFLACLGIIGLPILVGSYINEVSS